MSGSAKRYLEKVIPVLAAAGIFLTAFPARAQRVLVFPLVQEKGAPATEWIGTGLAVALDESLAVDRIASVPYEELRRYYDQENLVASPSFSRTSRVALAKELGAGVLVEGTFRVQGGRVETRLVAFKLSVDLERMGTWTEREALSDLLGLTRKLLEDLLTALGKAVPPASPVDPAAFESYIRGRIAEDLTLQEVYFRRALEIAPQYENARCHLAMALRDRGHLPESRALLESLEGKSYAKAYLGLLLLAEIRMAEGKLAEARKLLYASLKARDGSEVHLALARLNLKEKKIPDADRELVMARQFGSLDEDIESLQQEIQAEKASTVEGASK